MTAKTVEQWLAVLREDISPADLARAVAFDRSGAGIVIAAAVKQIVARRLDALVPDLVAAFERLGSDAKRDPGSRAKIAIARALHELDHWDDRVLVAGLRIVQVEGMDREDTAAALRGICGLAHAQFARDDALDVLGELLADPERTARIAAAQGIGDAGRRDGTALLRHKLLVGDAEPEVLSACCASLLALARDESSEFCIRLLADQDVRAEAAALALGSARVVGVTRALVTWSERCTPEQRGRVAYLALALLRTDDATAHLIEIVKTAARRDALAAARALATFKDDPGVAKQLRAAARGTAIVADIDELLG